MAVVATVVGGWLGQVPAMADQHSGGDAATPAARSGADAGARVPAAAGGRTKTREAATEAGGVTRSGARGVTPSVTRSGAGTVSAARSAVRTQAAGVWPKPQSMVARGRFAAVTDVVVLVAGPDADPYAVDVVDQALRDAGARQVVRLATPPVPPQGGGLTVYAGSAAQAPLRDLGASPAAGLPSGGYRLAVDDRVIALDGVGPDGLFHAAQTLRQLVTAQPDVRGFRAVTVRDWPAAPVRGTAESFYGVPWTQSQRLAQLDFMARTKQNLYLYAPGDDPYRRAQWKEPYPAAQRADFRALTARAAQDHVTVAWAVAPGESMCYSSAADQRALERKLDAMWALGARAFQLQFQDVSYSEWHCGADTSRFGDGPAAAARAQAAVAGATASYLKAKYGAAAPPLSLLPTEFYQDGATPYRGALAEALDPSVAVAWTGVGVLPGTITGAQVAAVTETLAHPVLTEDNYPVNDFAPDRLFLGPYTGREPAVATASAGVLAAGMQQPVASRVPLFTAADFAWNPDDYDPQASWQAAIDDLAGPGTAARQALRALAGDDRSSALAGSGSDSADLRPLVEALWKAQAAADPRGTPQLPAFRAAAARLRAVFSVMRTAPGTLGPLAGGAFGDEAGPWLDRMAQYGAAGEQAVDMLVAQAAGDGAKAWRARRSLDAARNALAQDAVTVGDGTLDDFLTRAAADGDAWLGLRADGRTATTTMASGHGTDPAAMVDGKDGSAWSSAAPPQPDDSFGVDLGAERPVSTVRVAMGDGSGSDDFLHDAVLEVAGADGTGWRKIGEYHDQAVISARLPEGTSAREVRLRATGAQPGAVTVREFSVTVSGRGAPTATGGAHASAAVDGDLTTAAGAGPLTVRFHGARQLDTVTVAADPSRSPDGNDPAPGSSPGPAAPARPVTVEVHVAGGGWRTIGTLEGAGKGAEPRTRSGSGPRDDGSGWTELPAGVLADAVRLSDGAGVREVVPWFAEAPRVTLDRPEVDAEAGGGAAEVTATVASGLPRNTSVTVVPAAPGADGIRVVAARPALPLPRGAAARAALRVSVPAGTAPGTYSVPVRFTVAGRTVQRRIIVRTHPRTGGPDLVSGAAASSSGNETPDFPASAVADGDPATRWSSPARDDAWVQVELPAQARIGRVELEWQDAYASWYAIQTSTDGVTWHTAATVPDGSGGHETVWLDTPQDARYLRVQGIHRATRYGYSLFGIAAYAVTN